jgi:hypothetical protein
VTVVTLSDPGTRTYTGSMGREPNDELWDPRPRLRREAEHVVGRIEDEPEQERADGEGATRPGQDHPLSVIVELSPSPDLSASSALEWARGLRDRGIQVDEEFGAMPFGGRGQPETFCVRVDVPDRADIDELERDPRVLKVWGDTPVAPFTPE